MRKQFFIMTCSAVVAMMAACSNKEVLQSEATIDLSEIQFRMQEEKFESGKGATHAITPEPETVDLGNGLTAEVSLVEDETDAPAPTRAPISDGKYFIYGYEQTTFDNTPLMKGTFKDGVFIRDADSPRLRLSPGTYTFVCGRIEGISNPESSSFFLFGGNNTMVGVTKKYRGRQ